MAFAQLGHDPGAGSADRHCGLAGGYFIAFNIQEATLPSLIFKSPLPTPGGHRHRGRDTAQLVCFGRLPGHGRLRLAVVPCPVCYSILMMLLWLFMAITMRPRAPFVTQMLALPDGWQGNRPLSVACAPRMVEEAVVIVAERVAPWWRKPVGTKQAPANQSGDSIKWHRSTIDSGRQPSAATRSALHA